MARGWESKAVEAQIEEKQTDTAKDVKIRTADQIQHMIEKRTLELARAKVAHELASSQNPRYAQMLQQSLSELDKKIAAID
jgi:methionyl-tRNA formyltransferase